MFRVPFHVYCKDVHFKDFTCPLENHSAAFICPDMYRFVILFLLHIYMLNYDNFDKHLLK